MGLGNHRRAIPSRLREISRTIPKEITSQKKPEVDKRFPSRNKFQVEGPSHLNEES